MYDLGLGSLTEEVVVRAVKFYVKSLMLFLVLSMVPGISITTQAAYVTIHNDFF